MRHHFTPARYYTTIGSHEPALRVSDGDTIVTTTVDARGYDQQGEKIAERGNPMTGPFYVEGAEVGDALAVELVSLKPNRTRGWSGTSLAPGVLDPEDVRELPESELADWEIDLDKNTATLKKPDTRLGALSLPLSPMVGCFGVAPAKGQAIGCDTSGPHGGNMDYRGFVQGAVVYFPVLAEGALFHIGDGHAVQGDGEIVGTGIEISFDVEFTLRVRKQWTIGWPRGENAEFLFTVGNARPLDQAVQHATSEMLRWLHADYGLDITAASILMGQAVRYDMGNVFDPAYTMVCKMSKNILNEFLR